MKQCTGFDEKMQKIKRAYLILALFWSLPLSLTAQSNKGTQKTNHRIGFVVGRGTQKGMQVKYRYHVVLLPLPEYYRTIWQKKVWSLNVLIHPQFNLTRLRPVDERPELKNGYEFGLNCGLVFRYMPTQKLGIYAGLSAGPHFVSATPTRQARGFIFSDNAFGGMNLNCAKNTWIDLRIGFRHISNAGLREPNGGVNNLMLSGGCLFDL